MNTCKDCKHWTGRGGFTGYDRQCQHPKLSEGSRYVGDDGVTGADCWTCMYTGPDFGCVHFEKSDTVAQRKDAE